MGKRVRLAIKAAKKNPNYRPMNYRKDRKKTLKLLKQHRVKEATNREKLEQKIAYVVYNILVKPFDSHA